MPLHDYIKILKIMIVVKINIIKPILLLIVAAVENLLRDTLGVYGLI